MNEKRRYKTGEEAPKPGIYKVDELIGGYQSEDYFNDTTIELAEGEVFPPAPAENQNAWWIEISVVEG